jgi:hypothetical protein
MFPRITILTFSLLFFYGSLHAAVSEPSFERASHFQNDEGSSAFVWLEQIEDSVEYHKSISFEFIIDTISLIAFHPSHMTALPAVDLYKPLRTHLVIRVLRI